MMKVPAILRVRALALLLAVAWLYPAAAFAACGTPTGQAGDQFYNTTYNQMQYCNGSNWVNMGSAAVSGGLGTLTNGDFCTTDGTVVNCTTAAISLSTQASGSLQAAQFPALTGDTTTTAGSLATTVARINGVALGSTTATAGNLLVGSGTQWVTKAITGDVTITSGGVTAIGSSKVTSGMLAGSIASSKLVGTDIATVGTITAGTWQGTGIGVPYGGTGVATFTSNGVLYGNGASAVQVTAQGGANTILTANAGAPAWSASPAIGTSVTTPLVIGGTSATSSLTLKSTSGTGTTNADIVFLVGTNGGTEAMRVLNSGKVGIGSSSPGNALDVNGTIQSTNILFTSDMRKKKDIAPLQIDALQTINQLKPVTFFWKEVKDGMQGQQIGFIAQDIETVIPQVVVTANDADKTKSLKYEELIPVLVKAVQDLARHNEQLAQDNKKLQDDVKAIRAQLDAKK